LKKIILASASAQRQTLLKQIGVKFKVIKSKAKEKRKITKSASELVKDNALAKAYDVARRLNCGIVLGCDTIVVVDNKIIGKPKSLKMAVKTLRFLSRRPQWVYTGLALIDINNNRTLTDFEKTKVFMKRLTTREINNYFKKVSPLNKAGAFDIQRYGGIFISRIEGCFYNVVGLPLAKLSQMLKKVGIHILICMLVFTFLGCATEYNVATGRQDIIFYGTEKEIKLGQSVSKAIEAEYHLVDDYELQRKVNKIGQKIVAVCDRRDINYRFKVLDDQMINAVSLPGGYIYLFKGLIDIAETDDEIACVIAHEVGHVVAKHSIKKLQATMGMNLLNLLLISTRDADVIRGVNAAFMAVFLEYSQEDEFLADTLAVKYAGKAGFNPKGMITFLEKLKSQKKIRKFSYWRTHPYINERIARVRRQIYGGIDFVDYLNIK
jgi:MAF protein